MMPEMKQGYFLQLGDIYDEQKWAAIHEWLHDNIGQGKYQIKQCYGSPTENVIFFKDVEYAIAFKLRWM